MNMLYDDGGGWPWQPEKCAYDRELHCWLRDLPAGKTVLHVGTGLHHYLGRLTGIYHNVIGWTASPEEMDAYVQAVIHDPKIASTYQCLFGDIHLVNPDHLPMLDVLSLPHLCEFTDPRRADYGGVDDDGVLRTLLSVLRPGGFLVLYVRSCAFDRALPIVRDAVDDGRLRSDTWGPTLVTWRRL